MKRYILCILAIGLSGQVQATQFKAGTVESVSPYQTVEDDMAIACRTLNMQGTIDGDLMVAARTLHIGGSVRDDVWAGAGSITIGGRVGDDLRAAAQEITIEGEVGSDVIAGCRYFTLSEGGLIKGDLTLGCGEGVLLGNVGDGVLLVGAEEVQIGGTIDGDMKIHTNRLVVQPSAEINGHLVYTSSNEADIDPGARIQGGTNWIKSEEKDQARRQVRGLFTVLKMALFFGLLVSGALLVGLFPQWAQTVADTITGSLWASLGIGLVFLICMPLVAVILCMTLAGIPLAIFSGFVYVALLYVGRIFVGLLIGKAIFQRVRKEETSSVLAVLLGLVLVMLLTSIPHIGWIIGLLITLAGMGALLITEQRLLTQARTGQGDLSSESRSSP